MKYFAVIMLAALLASCEKTTVLSVAKMSRVDATEIIQILQDHLPENAAAMVDSEPEYEDQFHLELTADQFKYLQDEFASEVKDYTSKTYAYDLYSSRATTFSDQTSAFSISLGKGSDYHYIITGSFVPSGDMGKAVIWVKTTTG